ncbi:hypothetical protein [Bradyrhizobium sp. CCBAU 53421]|uniref:hypothetical protein n=1 Tax=Bradyrhizobium sp. CCBAU 53421 TaxID=1325120 RepID=UPI00188A982D|nr:hypothetical protein [Bradyrhizobium sp. CCBAU 53421]QOZ33195.1 hypothetical protein XH92_17215 [Bradyrhizobium sp. CCBAU 53421]
MQLPTLLNDSTAFVLSPVELPAHLEHAYCSLFVDTLLDFASAHFWLDMSESELKAALHHVHDELFSFSKNDGYWALNRLFGFPPLPPTVSAVRRLLRALVAVPESYWFRRIELREARRRDEDEAKNGLPAEADEEPAEDEDELTEPEAPDNDGCNGESSAAMSEAGLPRGR